MAGILRGDIVWADLSPTRGHEQRGIRPVLVLSPEVFNHRSQTVIAVALTSKPQEAPFPFTLELFVEGLPKRSWVKISQIRTLSTERLTRKVGTVAPEVVDRIVEGLNRIIRKR